LSADVAGHALRRDGKMPQPVRWILGYITSQALEITFDLAVSLISARGRFEAIMAHQVVGSRVCGAWRRRVSSVK
jgi:hypothetical protein